MLRAVGLTLCVAPALSATSVPRAASTPVGAARNLVLLNENRLGGYSVVNIARGVRERVVGNTDGAVRSPDGWHVAFRCQWGSSPEGEYSARAICVQRIDGQTAPVVIRPRSGRRSEPWALQWSPNGRRLAFFWRDVDRDPWEYVGRLWTVRADGRDQRQLIPYAVDVSDTATPTWSPDGSTLACWASPSSGLYVVRSDGSRLHRISAGPHALANTPLWSPAGSLIAYWQVAPGTHDDGVYVVRPDGSHLRQLVGAKWVDRDQRWGVRLSWSADGRSIACSKGSVLVVDVRTGRRTNVGRGFPAIFAPVGDRMLVFADFHRSMAFDRAIVLTPGRAGRTFIADEGAMVWSYDGRQLAYANQDGLWVTDVVNRATRRVLSWDLPRGQEKGPLVWAS